MPKLLTVWIKAYCGKFLKRWEYQTTLPDSWQMCMQVKKQELKPDREQWTGSKLRKEYVKVVYFHPAYLTSMQNENASCKILGWMKHKLESRLPGEILMTSDMQMTPPFGRKWRTKEFLEESERGEGKSWFKMQHSFPLLFPIKFCESLWVSGLQRTLWEQRTAYICPSSPESPYFSSCSSLSPSSLFSFSCNSVNFSGCPSRWKIFSPLT